MEHGSSELGPAVPVSVSKPSWNPEEPESVEEVRQNTIDDDLALVWHDSNAVSIIYKNIQIIAEGRQQPYYINK